MTSYDVPRQDMTAKRITPDEALEWFLHIHARFSNHFYDHRDDADQRETASQAMVFCDEWEVMAPHLPGFVQAESAFIMFSECVDMKDGPIDDPNAYDLLTERCSQFIIESAKGLKRDERERFAYKVARISKGRFESPLFQRLLVELVGPTTVGDVLDVIRSDLYHRYKDSSDLMIDSVDDEYREFAEMLIQHTGRSSKGKLKCKLTMKVR
jgi:hypothetical protein